MIGFRRHSAQAFSVSKIYYSYHSEDKIDDSSASQLGVQRLSADANDTPCIIGKQ
jgi:hypothetical protein